MSVKYMLIHTYHDENGFIDAEVYESDIPDVKEAEKAREFYIIEDEIDPDSISIVQYKE